MRRALASLILALFLFPSIAMGETVKWDDLVITSGLYYKKFTNIPFTGKVTGKKQGPLKKGVMDGAWVEYNKDGRLSREVTYINGKEDTSVEYSYGKNGQLEFKITYKEGKLPGLAVYHRNGQLQCRGPLTTPTTIKYIKKNVFWICRVWSDLNLKQGAWVGYQENGKLAYKKTYKDGKEDGPSVYYYDNGQLTGKGTYEDGKRHGPWVFYHENGEEDPSGVTSKKYDVHEGSGTYKDGKKVSD